jgi:hypothetical protein
MAAMVATCTVVAYAIGFVVAGGKGYVQWGGYRTNSLDLLAPFDPYIYGSILSRLHYWPRESPTYPGSSYFGGGIIFLGILLLVVFGLRKGRQHWLDKRSAVPLLLCCVVLTIMALSTRIRIGSMVLVDVDPHQRMTQFLALLRMSLYLFWVPYYVSLTAVLAAPFLRFRRSRANLVLAIVLVVQLVDLAPLRAWAHSRVSSG